HGPALDSDVGSRVAVRVGAVGPEVDRRPAGIAHRLARAVGERSDLASSVGNGARRPGGRVRGCRGLARGHRASHQQERGGDPALTGEAPGTPDGMAARHHENLMSAEPWYVVPVVSVKVTFSSPGSVARRANEKKGFSLT